MTDRVDSSFDQLAARMAGGFYFTGDDRITLTSWNSLTAVVVTLTGRFLHLDGRIEAFSERHVPNTDRTAKTTTHARACGWLLDCSVLVSGAAPVRGQTFVRVDVVRGQGVVDVTLSPLFADYVTATHRPGYPASGVRSPLEGPGALRSITGTNPAAGVELSETVPTGARWRLQALKVTLVSDANVANREVRITFDDGTTAFALCPTASAQGANTTGGYTAAAGLLNAAANQGVFYTISLPPLVLMAGARIATVTANKQAGDDYGAPQLAVEEWLEAA